MLEYDTIIIFHTDGMSVVDSERHQRSVHETLDRQIDDILITEIETTTTAEPRSRDDHTWPNKTVYYTFSQTLSKCIKL